MLPLVVHVRPFPDQFRAALPRLSVAAVCVLAVGCPASPSCWPGATTTNLHVIPWSSLRSRWQWYTYGSGTHRATSGPCIRRTTTAAGQRFPALCRPCPSGRQAPAGEDRRFGRGGGTTRRVVTAADGSGSGSSTSRPGTGPDGERSCAAGSSSTSKVSSPPASRLAGKPAPNCGAKLRRTGRSPGRTVTTISARSPGESWILRS